jgi:hypothetical protein
MHIQSGHAVEHRKCAIQHGKPPKPSNPKQGPTLRSAEPADRLIPYHSFPVSSPASAPAAPQCRPGDANDAALPPAMQEAISRDDWTALSAAWNDPAAAGIDGLSLMRHAAQAGAGRIVFRLQSHAGTPVSPFAPDAASCAFYTALKHGKGQVAKAMLDSHVVMEQTALPDLERYLVAAVDNNDGNAIAWLVEFSMQKKCLMPYEFLNGAIRKPDPGQVEIMSSHPAFADVLDDVEIEYGVLNYAIKNGAASTLEVLLARKRVPGGAGWLCEQTGRTGNTLLHAAAASGDPAKLRLVLDFHPDIRREGASESFFARLFQGNAINARNGDGKTALAIATDAGHQALAAMLIARGAR